MAGKDQIAIICVHGSMYVDIYIYVCILWFCIHTGFFDPIVFGLSNEDMLRIILVWWNFEARGKETQNSTRENRDIVESCEISFTAVVLPTLQPILYTKDCWGQR